MSLAGAATSIIFVETKHVYCRDKSMLAATKLCLSQQACFCRDKYLSRQKYVCDTCLSRQIFLVTKVCLSRQKYLSRPKYVCRDKHTFVATSIILSGQNICHDRNDTCGSSR